MRKQYAATDRPASTGKIWEKSRKQKAESRKQKAESRKQKTEDL
jgi:hypothetical protein